MPEVEGRVKAPFLSDIVDLDDAIKDARFWADELGAKIGFYLPGHHLKLP